MPTPRFFEGYARICWPHRWLLGGITFGLYAVIGGIAGVSAAFAIRLPLPAGWLLGLFGVPICWLWGLTMLGVWFHPEFGTMRLGSPWFLRAPRFVQVFLRWYGSLFLAMWFSMPVLTAIAMLSGPVGG